MGDLDSLVRLVPTSVPVSIFRKTRSHLVFKKPPIHVVLISEVFKHKVLCYCDDVHSPNFEAKASNTSEQSRIFSFRDTFEFLKVSAICAKAKFPKKESRTDIGEASPGQAGRFEIDEVEVAKDLFPQFRRQFRQHMLLLGVRGANLG